MFFLSGLGDRTRIGPLPGILRSEGVGQAVIMSLHPVTGHLQMLTDIVMDVTQTIQEVYHLVGR
jgi:hypothetical protein